MGDRFERAIAWLADMPENDRWELKNHLAALLPASPTRMAEAATAWIHDRMRRIT